MRKLFLLLIALGASCALALGQARTVRGTVTSADDGGPLPQLTVLIKGTTTGVVTNLDGQYALTVPGPAAVLVFKYTGYETQEIPVGDRATIDVVMKPALEEIDQVVVMGYGSAKKISSSVGNVATVGESDLKEKPTANALEALSGKVAGMSVLTASGEPTAVANIRLHGNASLGAGGAPLYIVDGVPIPAGRVLAMNPSDFANVSVLTDASATSIYGARAANGVIYITTKQGRAGEEGRVTVRAMYGFSNIANTDYYENMMTSQELFDLWKEAGIKNPAILDAIQKKYDLKKTTLWYKELYGSNIPTYSGDVSFSGGTKGTRYYISGGYFSQEGLRPYSGFERYSLRTNVNTQVKSWLKVGVNSHLGYSISRINTAAPNGPQGLVLFSLPWISPRDKDGKEYQGRIPGTFGMYPPSYLEAKTKRANHEVTISSSGYLEIEPIQNLKIRSQAGVDAYINAYESKGLPSAVFRLPSPDAATGNGFAKRSMERDVSLTFTNTAEYTFTVKDDHHFTPLIGHEYSSSNYLTFSASVEGLTNDNLMELGAGTQDRTVEEGTTGYFFNSFFGRLEYDYKNKYFLSASLRDDQSSRFGKNNQHGLFWSVGFMWNAKREEFLRGVEWLSALRAKTSIGTSGNSAVGNFVALPQVGTATQYNSSLSLAYSWPGNPDLTWEKQLKFTIGADATLWNMWNIDLSFYYRRTSNMLMDLPVLLQTGFTQTKKNVGVLSNMGIDLKTSVVAWSSDKGDHVTPYLTFNYNRERIEELFDGKKFWVVQNTLTGYAVGRPVEYMLPLFYRIDPETGNPQWYLNNPEKQNETQRDKNKITELFDSNLEQVTGKPRYAPINGGFGLNASYWGFYLQADFMFVLGKWMISNDAFFYENPLVFGNYNTSKNVKNNFWTPKRKNAKYPSPKVKTWTQFDDRLLSNASFLRMKTLTFGYVFPKKWMEWTRFFQSAKIYTSLRNYLTVTNFNGPDPEPDTNLTYGGNPNTKQWTFGIELEF